MNWVSFDDLEAEKERRKQLLLKHSEVMEFFYRDHFKKMKELGIDILDELDPLGEDPEPDPRLAELPELPKFPAEYLTSHNINIYGHTFDLRTFTYVLDIVGNTYTIGHGTTFYKIRRGEVELLDERHQTACLNKVKRKYRKDKKSIHSREITNFIELGIGDLLLLDQIDMQQDIRDTLRNLYYLLMDKNHFQTEEDEELPIPSIRPQISMKERLLLIRQQAKEHAES